MIKGITFSQRIGHSAEFHRLTSFFDALGLELRRCLDSFIEEGRRFAAPCGNIEFLNEVDRELNNTLAQALEHCGKINIEVTSLDCICQIVQSWLLDNARDTPTTVGETVDTNRG
jgi:hypothetical protein